MSSASRASAHRRSIDAVVLPNRCEPSAAASPWTSAISAITVDAGADPAGLTLALRSTAPDGICTSTAIYFGEQPRLPLLEMYTTGVTFSTGRVHARPAIPHVLELTARGALHPERITTRTVSWNDALDALTASRWTKLVFCRE